ncbi:hypothetical protein BC830DRAFT_1117619, partial [Chytriomyces sp. MP71]
MSNMIVQLKPEAAGAMGGEYTSMSSSSSSSNTGGGGGGSTGVRRGASSRRARGTLSSSRGSRRTGAGTGIAAKEEHQQEDLQLERRTLAQPATRTEAVVVLPDHHGQRLVNATKPSITLALDPDTPTVQLSDDNAEDEEEVEDRDPDEAYLSSIVSESSPPEKPPSLPQHQPPAIHISLTSKLPEIKLTSASSAKPMIRLGSLASPTTTTSQENAVDKDAMDVDDEEEISDISEDEDAEAARSTIANKQDNQAKSRHYHKMKKRGTRKNKRRRRKMCQAVMTTTCLLAILV